MIYKLKIRKSQIITIITIVVSVACGVLFQKYVGVGKILKTIGMRHHLQPLITKLSLENNNPEEQHQGKLKLFILAGQSNMSGRGDLPQSGTNTNPNIYVFGNDYHWRLAAEPVDDPSNQVDKVSADIGPGFSPSLSFATTILKQYPDMVIGLIPCAMGGSSIYQWRRRLSDDSLYGSCLKRVRAASTMGDVAGLVFFQGESDALDPKQYPELTPAPSKWGDAFAAFVGDLRIDLNLPELPVVFAQIGTNTAPEKFINWSIIKAEQSAVRLPFCAMIATDDLPLKDSVHFTAASYQIIGRRFGETYLGLRQSRDK